MNIYKEFMQMYMYQPSVSVCNRWWIDLDNINEALMGNPLYRAAHFYVYYDWTLSIFIIILTKTIWTSR